MPTRNLAARAGHWSAHHRKKAIWGRVAFVLVCVLLGGAAGTKIIKDENTGNGDSRTAARVIKKEGLKERASEQVLIQSRGTLRAPDAAFRAAVLDVQRRVSQNPYVINLTSPYQPTHSGQTSPDERSALVLFQIRGDDDQAK